MRYLMLALTTACSAAVIGGCASDGYSSSSVSYGSSFYYGHSWYNDPYYWSRSPSYVVVAPDRPDRPDRPIERPDTRPTPLPAQPMPQPEPRASSRSRMPPAQPRMSSPSRGASIPRVPRGGMRR